LLGGVPVRTVPEEGITEAVTYASADEVRATFTPVEQAMVRSVLSLAERPVESIMTPRANVVWLDVAKTRDAALAEVRASPHRFFLLGRGSLDNVLGIVSEEEVLQLALTGAPFRLESIARMPASITTSATILAAFEVFRTSTAEMAFVVDSNRKLAGVVTRSDLLQAIAGHLAQPAS
jgi:CBS domain containing-hemolysin-like protein